MRKAFFAPFTLILSLAIPTHAMEESDTQNNALTLQQLKTKCESKKCTITANLAKINNRLSPLTIDWQQYKIDNATKESYTHYARSQLESCRKYCQIDLTAIDKMLTAIEQSPDKEIDPTSIVQKLLPSYDGLLIQKHADTIFTWTKEGPILLSTLYALHNPNKNSPTLNNTQQITAANTNSSTNSNLVARFVSLLKKNK